MFKNILRVDLPVQCTYVSMFCLYNYFIYIIYVCVCKFIVLMYVYALYIIECVMCLAFIYISVIESHFKSIF